LLLPNGSRFLSTVKLHVKLQACGPLAVIYLWENAAIERGQDAIRDLIFLKLTAVGMVGIVSRRGAVCWAYTYFDVLLPQI
jgi:hypothetical protein